jgi:hypothetical protein
LEEEAFRPDKNQREPDWGDLEYTSYESKTIPGCTSETYELTAGQYIDVGSLIVSNDDKNLYVTFVQDESYTRGEIRETHVFVGCGPDEIPLNGGGNPVIGHFPFSDDHGEVMQYTYEIPLDEFDCGTECLTIVAHAAIGGETAFGGCDDVEADQWDGRRWGCYFDYCPGDCENKSYGYMFKNWNPDENAVCFETILDEYGYSNSIHYDWLLRPENSHPELPILIDLGEDCEVGPYRDSYAANVSIDIIGDDLLTDPTLEIIVSMREPHVNHPDSYGKLHGYEIYVGWKNPVLPNGDLDPTVDFESKSFDSGLEDFIWQSKPGNWAGSRPSGDEPPFYVIVKVSIQ